MALGYSVLLAELDDEPIQPVEEGIFLKVVVIAA